MKLATFNSAGQDKIGIVHSNDSRIFDLAAAIGRDGQGNPAFASMLSLIDAGPRALEQAAVLFEKHGKDPALSSAPFRGGARALIGLASIRGGRS